MQHKNKIKVGLALGSGGVKGLAHIGVIKELEKNNIPIDFISGTSIGAIVGAHYALYRDIKKTEEINLKAGWSVGLNFVEPSFKGGFITGKKVKALFKEWTEDKKFSDLQIPFTAIATDLITGQEVIIDSGGLAKAIRASISVPAIFQPVEYEGKILADGGISNPLPDDVARHMGADVVIAVNLDNKYFENGFSKEKITLASASIRSLNIMRYHLAKNSTRTADIILEPEITDKIGLIGWSKFFDTQKSQQIINIGADMVSNNLAQIKELIN